MWAYTAAKKAVSKDAARTTIDLAKNLRLTFAIWTFFGVGISV